MKNTIDSAHAGQPKSADAARILTTGGRRPFQILLVEDNPADAELLRARIRASAMPVDVTLVEDGIAAVQFLKGEAPYNGAPTPDLVLLDLNLPRMDGRGVLELLKGDAVLRSIPVMVLSSSVARADVSQCYALHANAYVRKPVDIPGYRAVVQAIQDFWIGLVEQPNRLR